MSETSVKQTTPEERKKFEAEAEQALAEARKAVAEAKKFEAEAAVAEMERERKEREHRKWAVTNEFYHVYYFRSDVRDGSVSECVHQLNAWDRLDPTCAIEIIFTSPGGSVIDGMALFDHIQTLRRKGHRITTGALGYAASMAGILLQAGDTRWIGKEAWLLIHEASFGAGGKIGEVEDTVAWVKKVCERILSIFATRAAKVTGKEVSSVRRFVKRNWTRKDWWVSSDDALKYGFVDEVR